jgi:hypothetical protein
VYITYSPELYPFADIVKECLGIPSLGSLHNDKRAEWDLIERETDQKTPFHKLYYDSFTVKVKPVWDKFVREIIAPKIEDNILYQTIPTFRVQIPGNLAVGEFHYDSEYGHQDGAMNLFIPFVDVNEFNTIHAESSHGKGDFKPMLCRYGEVIVWDGVNLRHGNVINTSNETRVSMDARIISVSNFLEPTNYSINMKIPLGEGGYYTRLEK